MIRRISLQGTPLSHKILQAIEKHLRRRLYNNEPLLGGTPITMSLGPVKSKNPRGVKISVLFIPKEVNSEEYK